MKELHEKLQIIINDNSENNTYKHIAKLLIENFNNFDKLTIENLAELSFSSISSISRFIKNLGFNSFSELKKYAKTYKISRILEINSATKHLIFDGINDTQKTNDYIDSLVSSLSSIKNNIDFSTIDKINTLIYNSKNIAIGGSIFSASIANFFQIHMLYIGKYIQFYNFLDGDNSYLEKDANLFIIFSVEGNFLHHYKEKIVNLKLQNKKLVLITQNPSIILKDLFDEILFIGEYDSHKCGNYKLILFSEIMLSRYYQKYLPSELL